MKYKRNTIPSIAIIQANIITTPNIILSGTCSRQSTVGTSFK
nr:MAG TPA: hypothetical protein [Caudoviricetes sp.]